jgi:hypothetical protein
VRGRPECLTNLTVDHVLAEMRQLIGDPSESGLRLVAGLGAEASSPAAAIGRPEAGRRSAP